MKVCGIICALIAIAVPAMPGTPVGTAFTYQGKLTDSLGNPISGARDMTFKVFDALTAGSQVGATVAKTSVSVSGGLFTVQLDFSVGVFLGEKRWLETAVAGETLLPRVELTPTPNAVVAASALVTRSYESGLVSAADITVGDLAGNSQAKRIIALSLAYGQTMTLDLVDANCLYKPGEPQYDSCVSQLGISKTMRQLTLPGQSGSPDTQVSLADSPVVTIRILNLREATWTITLSPDDPVYNTENDPNCTPTTCPLKLMASLLSDSQLCIEVDKSYITVLRAQSVGCVGAQCGPPPVVGPYKQGSREVELTATVVSAGEAPAGYLVTVTELGPYAEPVVAHSVTLDPGESSTQKFTLRSTKAFTSADTCKVSLRSPFGGLCDSVIVHFPEPTAP